MVHIPLSAEVKQKTIQLRKNYRIKLPDAIIAASAIVNKTSLMSNDKQLSKIEELKLISIDIKP